MTASGERVYRTFDRAALDFEYDTRAAVPDSAVYLERRAEASRRARSTLASRLDVPYGATPDELLDIFPAGDGAPVVIYVHGGQWRARSKEDASFLAEAFVPAGVSLVAVGFALAPRVSLDAMVEQVIGAVRWVHGNGRSFGADPGRIHIAGHSSGAHLAAMALAAPWTRWGLPADTIKSASLTSGLYDLEPVRLSSYNEWLGLDPESTARNSPIHHLPAAAGPLTIAVGGAETSEFQRQTRVYADAWQAAGHPCTVLDFPEHHHYSMMLELHEAGSPLLAATLAPVLEPPDRRASPG